ncbi:aspartic peptidase domain-containing protein [Mycena filopes]|nr:aspartic peptidase domain-containing protein [Mycena filopes]
MLLTSPVFLLTFALLGDLSCALQLNFQARRLPTGLRKRGPLSSVSQLDNAGGAAYTTNITVGGTLFEVEIDTGSSDLVLYGQLTTPGSDSGKTASISYADGNSATGPVQLAPVVFGGLTVPNQAFSELHVPSICLPGFLTVTTPVFMSAPPGVGSGILGLGPSSGSVVYQAFDGADEGNPVLDNLFIQNKLTPNFISFRLSRLDDPSEPCPGTLTVGEVLSEHTAVTSEPKLPVTTVPVSDNAFQHFQILLDADGFIGPNGSAIPITSAVASTSDNRQATVDVDTGFTFAQVPASVAEGIYGQIDGAELVDSPAFGSRAVWFVPCSQEVNISLKFGGNAYPVHPLDATLDPALVGLPPRNDSRGSSCVGLFQPFSFDTGSSPTYDIIFGMPFLRNVYTLINYGDFVADSTDKADPYIQFLSITDPAEAHADFVKARLAGVDPSTPPPPSVRAQDALSVGDDDDGSSSSKANTTHALVAGCISGVILLLLGVLFILRRSRAKKGRGVYGPLPPPGAGAPLLMYQKRSEPASYAA